VSAGLQLGLGTAQFGMTYGIAGRGCKVPEDEVRAILNRAFALGIRTLDTAPAYGNIEAQLAELVGSLEFCMVSKIPAVPSAADPTAVARFVRRSIEQSCARLGARLRTILFHRGTDLLQPHGAAAWDAACVAASSGNIRLGVSCYSPEEAREIRASYPIKVAQFPGNALDQRLLQVAAAGWLGDVEIHLRSAFLQGLLLISTKVAASRVPKATAALAAWSEWHRAQGLNALQAALGVVKALPGVRCCIVGVDNESQLEEIVHAWELARPLLAPVAVDDPDTIDPRRWAPGP